MSITNTGAFGGAEQALFTSGTTPLNIASAQVAATLKHRFITPGMLSGLARLADFVGLDTTMYIADVMFEEFKEPRFAAPTLLRHMVAAGWLGRKSGRGFYNYAAGEQPPSAR